MVVPKISALANNDVLVDVNKLRMRFITNAALAESTCYRPGLFGLQRIVKAYQGDDDDDDDNKDNIDDGSYDELTSDRAAEVITGNFAPGKAINGINPDPVATLVTTLVKVYQEEKRSQDIHTRSRYVNITLVEYLFDWLGPIVMYKINTLIGQLLKNLCDKDKANYSKSIITIVSEIEGLLEQRGVITRPQL